MEEQALIFWIYASEKKLKAAIKFAVFLSILEILLNGIRVENLQTIEGIFEYAVFRIPASAAHIAGALLAYALVKRSYNIYIVWFVCATIHWLYNYFASPLLVCEKCAFG